MPVDWVRLKQHMAEAEEAWARGYVPTPEKRRQLLEARARSIAVPPRRSEEGSSHLPVIEFAVAQHHFAVDSAFVREVRPLDDLTPLPCTPAFVSGIINAHGRILAVIDLKTFLELPESGLNDLNRVIILQSGDLSVGLLADRIVGADRLPLADLHASPPRGVAAHAGCVRGVTGAGLVVLDAERLINDPGLALDDEGAA
ncbi:MAG TPA: chemotaxis protein CheW [Albitalea sp.]